MASTYVNNLRLEEIADGEQSGTWGQTTNTNLELIADAFGYGTEAIASDANSTITMADGAADEEAPDAAPRLSQLSQTAAVASFGLVAQERNSRSRHGRPRSSPSDQVATGAAAELAPLEA